MITIYAIKPFFQSLLKPIVHGLAKTKITPNQITLFALLLSMGWGTWLCFFPSFLWTLPLILLVRMALNAIDGMYARMFSLQSKLGVYLNEMGDILSDLFLYIPFVLLTPGGGYFVGSILILSVLSEIAGILAVSVGSLRRYDGPMGKSDRAFGFSILSLFFAFGWKSLWLIHSIYAMMAFLLLLTIGFRIKKGLSAGE